MPNMGPSEKKSVGQIRQLRSGSPKFERVSRETTKRRRVDEELDKAWSEWETTFDTIQDSMMLLDSKFRISQANLATSRLLGMPLEEIIGKKCCLLVHESNTAPESCPLREAETTKERHETEFYIDRHDIWAAVSVYPILDEQGNTTGAIHMMRDITEHKKAVEAIEQSERRYRELFENMTSGVAVYEAVDDGHDFVFKDFNRAGESIDCIDRKDLIGKRVTEVFPRVEDFGLFEVFKRVYETGEPEFFPQSFYEDQKISGWRENRVYKLPTGEIVAIYNDISKRKQMEDDLRLDESRLEALLKLSQMTGASLGEIADFAMEQAVGLTKSAIGFIGFLDEDKTIMNVHAWSKEVMAQCAVADKPLGFPLDKAGIWADAVRLRKAVIVNDYAADNPSKKGCPEGHAQLTRVMSVPISNGNRIAGVIAVANKEEEYQEADIRQLTLLGNGVWKSAQRMKAENELRASEEKHRFLFDAVPAGIAISDFDGNLLDCNRDMQDMMGYGLDELKSMNVVETYAIPQERTKLLKLLEEQGSVRDWEHKSKKADGSIHYSLMNVDVIERDGKKVLLTTSRDITKRKKTEESLRQMALLPQLNPAPVLRFDPNGVILLSNEAAVEILGDIVKKGAGLKDVLPSLSHVDLKHCIDQGLVLTEEVRINDRYFQFTIHGITDLGLGQAYGSDITKRKKAENALKEAHGKLEGRVFQRTMQLAGTNAELKSEIAERKIAEKALRESQAKLSEARNHLEDLVQERTAELRQSNRQLELEIAERTKAAQKLDEKQTQLKTLTSELALAEERERRRIAVGIHDGIGQKMALAKLELQSSMTSPRGSKMAESMESVCARIDEAIKETHSLTFELSNPALYELSFDVAIEQWLFEQIQKKQNIKCEVTANVEPVELGVNLKVVLFQAIRELAVNVVKYAGASNLCVRINKGNGRIVINMEDDGVGFVPSEAGAFTSDDKGGFGLFNIRERLEYLGGSMEIQSAPEKGTIITLTAPLDQQDDIKPKGVRI